MLRPNGETNWFACLLLFALVGMILFEDMAGRGEAVWGIPLVIIGLWVSRIAFAFLAVLFTVQVIRDSSR